MAEEINLTSKTRLKTNTIYPNSMCMLRQKKSSKLFIGQAKGIHIYDTSSQKFEDVKLVEDNSGVLSCLTQNDDLVFFCFGMRIYACGSNGRVLYDSDTYLAVDRIESIHVYGYQLWLVSGNLVSEFLIGGVQLSNKQTRITPPPAQKIQDVKSQIYDVKINHSILFKIDADKPLLLLLKNNNQIESFNKKDGINYTTETPPTCGYIYPSDQNNRLLVGTVGGEILYLEIDKKKIKLLWTIKQNSKGKINCIVQVKNGFIVFQDECFQMWNQGQQFLGRQAITDKIVTSYYFPQEQSLFYGTGSGQVVQRYNYQKMMKLAKQRDEQSQKNKMIRQIQQLRKLKSQLKAKVDKIAPASTSSGSKNIKITTNLSLDYSKICYCIQFVCEKPIAKIMLKGDIKIIETSQKISFQGKQNEANNVYMIRTQQKKSIFVRFQFSQKYHQNDKLQTTVYYDLQSFLIASHINVDLKYLCLHQKIDSKLLDRSSLNANSLRISGQFKYFQMTAWLSSIFSEIGSPSLEEEQEYIQFCYESIITKNKLYVLFKDKQAIFYSESPTPLSIIKKSILEKSKQKQLSLNYDTKTSLIGAETLLKKIAPKMKSLEDNKKQYQLLPGLQQLQSQQLGSDLKEILGKSDQIKRKYNESQRQYEELKSAVIQFYVSYRALNNKQSNPYQIDEISKSFNNFSFQKVIKMIQT